MKKNYMLCIDLMTRLMHDNLPQEGKAYSGVLIVTGECDATFTEDAAQKPVQRNVRVYDGKYITLTLRPKDDHLRLNFKEVIFHPGFDRDQYAIEVMMEISKALKGFV